MDFNTLRYNLQQPYQRNNWKEWLLQLFGQQISIETQAEKIVAQKGNANAIERFASIALSDDKRIAVLDIKTTSDIQIARNRVALRDIAFKLIDQDKYHGLIVFYHSEDAMQLDYRLSFISSQTSIDEDGNISTQSTNAKRYSFILGANESCNTATNRLLDLKNRVPKFKAFELQKGISLKDVTDAFSVEALNNEFFKKYKDIHYKRFWEYIANKPEYAAVLLNTEETELAKQQKPIRDFVKKMLGRIVFLHFLQKKGWMGCPADNEVWIGGDKSFMLNLFEGFKNKENYYSQCLNILFFQTLNTDRRKNNDIAPKELIINNSPLTIKIPFLNGGLFDDELPQTNVFDFPIDYFKDLFDFFSQYNFTIDENSPEEQEVGIDPEMLGHIFENLLEENKDKGAFYTPKEIVHYMCQESLIQYLRTHLPECTEDESQATKAIEVFIRKDTIGDRADKKNYIVANAKRIEAILDKVKICDPAIGSGAFPMGMLQEIFKAKTTLDLTLDKAQVKKEIIQNSIYGVDIEKGAVDIARLRFWLSLVVDEDIPQPLPNLDYKIMQGNSLLESFEEVDLSTLLKDDDTNEPILYANNEQVKLFDDVKQTLMVFDKADKQDLQKLINLYFDFEENSKTKYKTKQEIKQAINAIVEGKLKAHFYIQKVNYEAEKTELQKGIIANAIKPTDPKGIVDKKTKNLALVTKKLDAIEYKINHLTDILHKLNKWETEDKERPYFLWHTYFKDVFDKGGFDIVIGNPPYIKVQSIAKKSIQYLKDNFKSATGKFDIYVIFIEYAFRLIRKNGCITFINPHRFLISEYGEGLRKFLFEKRAINKAVYFGVEQIFETATTYTGIFLLKENSEKLSYVIPKTRDLSNLKYSVKEYKNSNFNFNFLLDTKSNLIIEKITKNKKVSELFDGVYQGIIPMGDEIQVLKGEIDGKYFIGHSKGLGKDIKIESDIVKPILKGENIERFMLLRTKNYIFYPHYIDKKGKTKPYEEDYLKANFPLAYEYILNFKNELIEKKKKYKTNTTYWYTLHRSREGFIFETPKLITPQLQNHPSFTLDNNKFYADAGGYMILHKKGDSVTLKTYLSIFNSKLFYYFIKMTSTPYNNDYYYFKTNYIEPFGIPSISADFDKSAIQIIDKILSLKSTNNSSIYYENKIDALVFHLYGLTEVEMNQVLDTFKDLSIKDRNQIQNEYWNIANNKFKLEI